MRWRERGFAGGACRAETYLLTDGLDRERLGAGVGLPGSSRAGSLVLIDRPLRKTSSGIFGSASRTASTRLKKQSNSSRSNPSPSCRVPILSRVSRMSLACSYSRFSQAGTSRLTCFNTCRNGRSKVRWVEDKPKDVALSAAMRHTHFIARILPGSLLHLAVM